MVGFLRLGVISAFLSSRNKFPTNLATSDNTTVLSQGDSWVQVGQVLAQSLTRLGSGLIQGSGSSSKLTSFLASFGSLAVGGPKSTFPVGLSQLLEAPLRLKLHGPLTSSTKDVFYNVPSADHLDSLIKGATTLWCSPVLPTL